MQFTQADFMDDVQDVWKSSVKGVKNTFSVSLFAAETEFFLKTELRKFE
jgi:hypothetical protein